MKEEASRDGPSASKTHRGLVSVPGPANSDAYAVGGDLSDEEGGVANGYYLDPIKVFFANLELAGTRNVAIRV